MKHFCLSILALISFIAEGQYVQISPTNGGKSVFTGKSLDVEDSILVAGVPRDLTKANNAGKVTVYRKREGKWVLTDSLFYNSPLEGQLFGQEVAYHQGTLAVGCPGCGENGEIIIYRIDLNGFVEEGRVTSPYKNPEGFGENLALYGNTLVAGAYGNSTKGELAGAAHIFKRTGTNWGFSKTIYGAGYTYHQYFGNAVAINSKAIAVGAYWDRAVHVFDHLGTFKDILKHTDPISLTEPMNEFGYKLDMSEEYLAVSSPAADLKVGTSVYSSVGHVYVFKTADWTLMKKIPGLAGWSGYRQGCSDIQISTDKLLVSGARNNKNFGVYEYDLKNTTWTFVKKHIPYDVATTHGGYVEAYAMAINYGEFIIADLFSPDIAANRTGNIYVYNPDPVLGIENENGKEKFYNGSNPVNGLIEISVPADISVKIHSVEGSLMYSGRGNSLDIQAENWPAGVYIATFSDESGNIKSIEKLLKF